MRASPQELLKALIYLAYEDKSNDPYTDRIRYARAIIAKATMGEDISGSVLPKNSEDATSPIIANTSASELYDALYELSALVSTQKCNPEVRATLQAAQCVLRKARGELV